MLNRIRESQWDSVAGSGFRNKIHCIRAGRDARIPRKDGGAKKKTRKKAKGEKGGRKISSAESCFPCIRGANIAEKEGKGESERPTTPSARRTKPFRDRSGY